MLRNKNRLYLFFIFLWDFIKDLLLNLLDLSFFSFLHFYFFLFFLLFARLHRLFLHWVTCKDLHVNLVNITSFDIGAGYTSSVFTVYTLYHWALHVHIFVTFAATATVFANDDFLFFIILSYYFHTLNAWLLTLSRAAALDIWKTFELARHTMVARLCGERRKTVR